MTSLKDLVDAVKSAKRLCFGIKVRDGKVQLQGERSSEFAAGHDLVIGVDLAKEFESCGWCGYDTNTPASLTFPIDADDLLLCETCGSMVAERDFQDNLDSRHGAKKRDARAADTEDEEGDD